MSEKRFTFDYEVEFEIFDRVTKKHYDGRVGCQEKICDLLNEQQATIEQLKQELEEYKENWDDMVELATKTSLRNVELDEQIGQLKAQLREKEEDEQLYANEIVKLNKEAKEVLDFKSLGGDY
jgi:adenylate kinase family enzyme